VLKRNNGGRRKRLIGRLEKIASDAINATGNDGNESAVIARRRPRQLGVTVQRWPLKHSDDATARVRR